MFKLFVVPITKSNLQQSAQGKSICTIQIHDVKGRTLFFTTASSFYQSPRSNFATIAYTRPGKKQAL